MKIPSLTRHTSAPEHPKRWLSKTYGARLGVRADTFAEAIRLLCERTSADRTIVETGCVRERNDYSAGYSTALFGALVSKYGGQLFTVDNSERNMMICRRVTRRWSGRITYNVSDSIAYLRSWSQAHAGRSIDLLYLDSWDYLLSGAVEERQASQRHCLGEFEAALPHLHERSLVLIDDGDLPGGGKPLLAKRRLAELGWTCVIDAYQTLWSAPMSVSAAIRTSIEYPSKERNAIRIASTSE